MKIHIECTTRIVEIEVDGAVVPARVWEGHTESGIPVTALVTRLAADRTDDLAEFERELAEQRPPSVHVDAWPDRLVL